MTAATLLLRQVHPSFVHGGTPSSQAFRPTSKDAGLLSVYDGDLITPDAAWTHYTATLGHGSAGVAAVTPEECAAVGLQCRPDPVPFPEHAVIDFTGLTPRECDKRSKLLKAKAAPRKWVYRPAEPG